MSIQETYCIWYGMVTWIRRSTRTRGPIIIQIVTSPSCPYIFILGMLIKPLLKVIREEFNMLLSRFMKWYIVVGTGICWYRIVAYLLWKREYLSIKGHMSVVSTLKYTCISSRLCTWLDLKVLVSGWLEQNQKRSISTIE